MPPSPFRAFATLPKDHAPAFPDRCVACCEPTPARSVTIWTMTTSGWVVLLPIVLLFSKATRVRFPACSRCAWRIRLRRLFSIPLTYATVGIAVYCSYRWFESWLKIFRRLAAAGAGLLAFVPWAALEVFLPPAVAVTLEGDTLKYEFREIEFSAEFRQMNQAALIE